MNLDKRQPCRHILVVCLEEPCNPHEVQLSGLPAIQQDEKKLYSSHPGMEKDTTLEFHLQGWKPWGKGQRGSGKWESPLGGGHEDLSTECHKWFLTTLQGSNNGLGTSATGTAVQGCVETPSLKGFKSLVDVALWDTGQCGLGSAGETAGLCDPGGLFQLTPEFRVLLHLHWVSRSPSAAASCYECTPTTLAGHQTPSEWSKTGNTQRKISTWLQFWTCPLHKGSATAMRF